jgi:replication-associated recombination protein RarA
MEGYGKDYSYSHDEEGSFSAHQRYLPEELGDDVRYYEPKGVGYEAQIKTRMEEWSRRRNAARKGPDTDE